MAPADAATRLASSGSGWLTSSGSIDHGRFQPGEVLDGRYRILGLLGRGGMGEVYRADDLRLGQQVALKFLPQSLGQDPTRLAQFHNEVRTARQVSHPNVCRVYDIGEISTSGSDHPQLFITMEYVDGEDLSALLRRIGRFPEDKALEIARQICAGLAAAHDKGILHRDLKPANIMLDGAGRVRLMDFSLASVGVVTDIRAGTPGYMAPEQLLGREVTTRSDIFSLGLVLYELFTGKRAFNATTVGELVSQHETGVTTSMSDAVKAIDPTVERVITRCLDPDPARRPPSALAVAGQLGADPIAAALAAGETPSPEMLAAAGSVTGAFTARTGLILVASVLVLLGVIAGLSDRESMPARVPLNKSVDVLVDRARQIRQQLGYTDPFADDSYGYRYDGDYLVWAAANADGQPWASLPSGRPAAIRLWYRTSPQPMIPFDDISRGGISDPPVLVSGMVRLEVDTEGRLLSFVGVPRQVEVPSTDPVPPVDWNRLFELAGLRMQDFRDVKPGWTSLVFSDQRRAWEGTVGELPNRTVRVEASAYRGRVVTFDFVAPWNRATREVPLQTPRIPWFSLVGGLLVFSLPFGASWMAWRNVQAGRGDTRGALKLGISMFALTLGMWAIAPSHVPVLEAELGRFFMAIGFAMFQGGLLYALYLAVEPHVRRLWPGALMTWSRLVTGRWNRDPQVGRDLVIGTGIGLALTAVALTYAATPRLLGLPEPTPGTPDLAGLMGFRDWVIAIGNRIQWALQNAFIGVLVLSALRMVISRHWVLVILVTLVFTIVSNRNGAPTTYLWFDLAVSAVLAFGIVVTLVRFGLFATFVTFVAHLVSSSQLLTLDGSKIYFAPSLWTLLLIAGMAAIGYWWARASR